MPTPGFVYSSENLNSFQITPQDCGGVGDQLLISGREQGDLQLAVFEIPPADYGAVYEDGRPDDSSEVEDVPHMLFGQEQAFCFLIAQHKLVKACKEQAIDGSFFRDDDGKIYLFYQGSADNGKTWYLSKAEIGFENGKPVLK
mgnify:CR=1 FL=1